MMCAGTTINSSYITSVTSSWNNLTLDRRLTIRSQGFSYQKIRQKLEASEMKVLRKIVGKTKIDRIRSQQIRESCSIQTINEWVERRRREWDQHVTRMDAEIVVKIYL